MQYSAIVKLIISIVQSINQSIKTQFQALSNKKKEVNRSLKKKKSLFYVLHKYPTIGFDHLGIQQKVSPTFDTGFHIYFLKLVIKVESRVLNI